MYLYSLQSNYDYVSNPLFISREPISEDLYKSLVLDIYLYNKYIEEESKTIPHDIDENKKKAMQLQIKDDALFESGDLFKQIYPYLNHVPDINLIHEVKDYNIVQKKLPNVIL